MKAEARGKYPGIKLHLDEKECGYFHAPDFNNNPGDLSQELPSMLKEVNSHLFAQQMSKHFEWDSGHQAALSAGLTLLIEMRKLIVESVTEHPDLLKPRTLAQVKEELIAEQLKCEKKLASLAKGEGEKWKKIKVITKVEVEP